jgi:hypothetical protein
MHRIDSRTVEYTTFEMTVVENFDQYLDQGLGIQDAALKALEEVTAVQRTEHMSMSFAGHLSDGTVGYSPLTGEFYKRYPNTFPINRLDRERCPVCGQADNCGDCTHQPA